MKVGKDKYRLLKEHMMDGYAYHQIVRDSSGTSVDYIFLDVNPLFETVTGLARDDILGKTATEVLPGIKESGVDWIGTYGQVAIAIDNAELIHTMANTNFKLIQAYDNATTKNGTAQVIPGGSRERKSPWLRASLPWWMFMTPSPATVPTARPGRGKRPLHISASKAVATSIQKWWRCFLRR